MRPLLVAVAALTFATLLSGCPKSEKDGDEDTTAPEVDATFPVNGGNISVGTSISATFSEAMDPATITTNTFRLSSGATLVPGVVSYADDTATFTPTSALAGGATFTAQILAEVQDEAGNEMESSYSWSFTTSAGEFALSSTDITPGVEIPTTYTCDGTNISPTLAWTDGPVGTAAYAIVFTDISNGFIHWILYDIPLATTSLVQAIPNQANPTPPGGGSKQVRSYDNATYGYLGPCPPSVHTYEFVVYAVDVATLPNVTTASTRDAVETEILAHDLGSASFASPYTP